LGDAELVARRSTRARFAIATGRFATAVSRVGPKDGGKSSGMRGAAISKGLVARITVTGIARTAPAIRADVGDDGTERLRRS
jgi:hypothetical protein